MPVKNFFIKYLEDFRKHKPEKLKIIVIDNAAFYSTKDIILPENIVFLPNLSKHQINESPIHIFTQ